MTPVTKPFDFEPIRPKYFRHKKWIKLMKEKGFWVYEERLKDILDNYKFKESNLWNAETVLKNLKRTTKNK